MPDVLIIGGGPAGAMAALLLARRNWNVALIEQHVFPRDKVCGECLSALAIEVLGRHGLLPLPCAVELTHVTLYPMAGPAARIPLGRRMLGLSRARLDASLLAAARESGVNILQPARCEAMRSSAEGVEADVRDLANNRLKTISASVALVADGKGAILPPRPSPTADFGLKAHFTHVEIDS